MAMRCLESELSQRIQAGLLDPSSCSDKINLAPSAEFVKNHRGERLHLRTSWPSLTDSDTDTVTGNGDGFRNSRPLRGVILSLHGYCAHSSRPAHALLAHTLTQRGWAYAAMDFHGHGHSDGERALVENPAHLVDDVLAVLCALFGLYDSLNCDGCRFHLSHTVRSFGINNNNSITDRPPFSNGEHSTGSNERIPLYIMGQSMGGGTALLVSHLLRHLHRSVYHTPFCFVPGNAERLEALHKHFEGAILFSPLIELPPFAVRGAALLSPLAALHPSGTLPDWLINENEEDSLAKIWRCAHFRQYISNDTLTYRGNTRFQTLQSLVQVADLVQKTIAAAESKSDEKQEIDFPILLFFDPEDAAVKFSGGQRLINAASHPETRLVVIPNGGHDLQVNELNKSLSETLSWLESVHIEVSPGDCVH